MRLTTGHLLMPHRPPRCLHWPHQWRHQQHQASGTVTHVFQMLVREWMLTWSKPKRHLLLPRRHSMSAGSWH